MSSEYFCSTSIQFVFKYKCFLIKPQVFLNVRPILGVIFSEKTMDKKISIYTIADVKKMIETYKVPPKSGNKRAISSPPSVINLVAMVKAKEDEKTFVLEDITASITLNIRGIPPASIKVNNKNILL